MSRRDVWSRAAFALILGLAAAAGSFGDVRAATIMVAKGRTPSDVTLSLVGTIRSGDDAKFGDALAALQQAGLRVTGVGLNGPGGETNTSLSIAKLVRDRRLPVFISSICASGCAIIAIAAPARVMTRGAAIAVHEAYRIGADGKPKRAPDATAYVAGRLRDYGVPEAIIRKLEQTPFYRMSRLSRTDLALLDSASPAQGSIR